MRKLLQCLAVGMTLLTPLAAHCQSDPIATLLNRYQLARTPFDAEGLVVPGSLIVGGDGVATQLVLPYEISASDVGFADAALKDMTIVPLESVDGGSGSASGGGVTIQKWAPGVTVKNSTGLVSDQALFTVAEISSTAIDKLVLHQSDIEGIWKDWNRDVTRNVWLVQAVFYTKELNVADSTARQVTLATGGKLPDCPITPSEAAPALKSSPAPAAPGTGTLPVPTTTPASAGDKAAPGVTPAPTTKPTTPDTNGVSLSGNIDGYKVSLGVSTPSDSKTNTASNIQKGVAAATTVATTAASVVTGAASGTLITAYGFSCRDTHDVAHLVSATPVAIGVKVVPVGHFVHIIHVGGIPTGLRSKPTDFSWDVAPATQPVFTNAKQK